MIRARIKIGGGDVLDTFDAFGFCYLRSDDIFSAPLKEMEKTAYPEQEGENILPKTTEDAFDYKVSFLVEGRDSIEKANAKIVAFNEAICPKAEGSDDVTVQQITFYNPSKNVTIVGYPSPVTQATKYWADSEGNESNAAEVELLIRVTKPSLCNFKQCE